MDPKEGREFSGDGSSQGRALTEKTGEGLAGLAWKSHEQWHRSHSDTGHLEPVGKIPMLEDPEACHLRRHGCRGFLSAHGSAGVLCTGSCPSAEGLLPTLTSGMSHG